MAGGIGGLPSFGPGDVHQVDAAEQPEVTRMDEGRAGRVSDRPRPRPLALREVPAEERPRERLHLRGAAGLTTAELVALVWGAGSRGVNAVDLAEQALARVDGIAGLARASTVELQE